MDHKDHRSIGTLIAVDDEETQASLIAAFVDADIPEPSQARDAASLRAMLDSATLDLIVMSDKLAGAYVAPLISDVRRGKLGPHPFPIVVVLTHETDPAEVRQISNCGPDDIVALPCEPEDMLARINVFLAGNRRPLVVNAGYAGPERRNPGRVEP